MSPASSSRWCPTPEQLMILEEMYRSGIRTPSASQIQHITAHLSFYGRIEGKNVFYWFQNHKARERQKLRRKLGIQLQRRQQQHYFPPHQFHEFTQSSPHLFHYFGSPASPLFQQLSSSNSTKFLPLQGGGGGGGCEDASTQMMNYTWKLDMPSEGVETDKSLMGMYGGRDWMMMMVDLLAPPPPPPPSPCCAAAAASRPPLKTLELFPITATNLKEECNPSN